MSKMVLVAIAAIAALFGSMVTWAVTERPVQAASGSRAAGSLDQGRSNFGPVTRETVESRLKERFAGTDTNGDGFVTRNEAESAGDKARTERRNFAFGTMDADKNGVVSRPEFEAQADAQRAQFKEGHRGRFGQRRGSRRHSPGFIGARQFERMDANNDGRLTYDEALAPALVRFKSADTDGDGSLTRAEQREARQKFRGERRARN